MQVEDLAKCLYGNGIYLAIGFENSLRFKIVFKTNLINYFLVHILVKKNTLQEISMRKIKNKTSLYLLFSQWYQTNSNRM